MEWLESACKEENGEYSKNNDKCCIPIGNDLCAESFGNPPQFVVNTDIFTKKRRLVIYSIFAALYAFVIYLLVGLGTFQSVNVGITITFAILLLIFGKKIRKTWWFALMAGATIILIIALPIAIIFFITGEYVWHDYGYFDFTSHFLSGFFIFFFLSAVLKERNLWKIFGYAILVELAYEGIEIFLDVILNEYADLDHLHWDFYNMLLDLTMHVLAGLIAIAILRYYKKKSSVYMDTPILE